MKPSVSHLAKGIEIIATSEALMQSQISTLQKMNEEIHIEGKLIPSIQKKALTGAEVEWIAKQEQVEATKTKKKGAPSYIGYSQQVQAIDVVQWSNSIWCNT